jgi:hypothetical protein
LPAELGGIRRMCSWHRGLLLPKGEVSTRPGQRQVQDSSCPPPSRSPAACP